MMIPMDKKSSKSYVNPVNFAIFQFCSQLGLAGSTCRVAEDRGAGARENRGREGYGRREKKGREAGSLR